MKRKATTSALRGPYSTGTTGFRVAMQESRRWPAYPIGNFYVQFAGINAAYEHCFCIISRPASTAISVTTLKAEQSGPSTMTPGLEGPR